MNKVLYVSILECGYIIFIENENPISIYGKICISKDEPVLQEVCALRNIEINDLVDKITNIKNSFGYICENCRCLIDKKQKPMIGREYKANGYSKCNPLLDSIDLNDYPFRPDYVTIDHYYCNEKCLDAYNEKRKNL